MTKTPRGNVQIIPALARGETVATAAKLAGLSERTVYRRLQDPDFRRQVSNVRFNILDRATGQLLNMSDRAIETLVALLDATSESVRLGAARSILDHTIKFREISEFEIRLQMIENAIAISRKDS